MDLRESIRREKRREKRIPHVGGMNDVASESRSGVDKVEEKKRNVMLHGEEESMVDEKLQRNGQ